MRRSVCIIIGRGHVSFDFGCYVTFLLVFLC